MRCVLIAVVLAKASLRVCAQAQEVCTDASCGDDSSMGEVSLMQKTLILGKPTGDEKRSQSERTQTVISKKEIKNELPLLDQMAYLAGHMGWRNNAQTTLKEEYRMGWEQIHEMVHKERAALDRLAVFRKTVSAKRVVKMCAIAFSATDDVGDAAAQFKGAVIDRKRFCGADGVNGGYADEIRQFMRMEDWPQMISKLENCNSVFAVGHSMGGALASLFAFCSNTKVRNAKPRAFGSLPEVHLFTFGAPGPARVPLYNGLPGMCFQGARRFLITREKKRPSLKFVTESLMIFADLCDDFLQKEDAGKLRYTSRLLQSGKIPYPSRNASQELKKSYERIGRKWLYAYGLLAGSRIRFLRGALDGYRTRFLAFMAKYEKEIRYSYDPVPQLFDESLGFTHPLIEVEEWADEGSLKSIVEEAKRQFKRRPGTEPLADATNGQKSSEHLADDNWRTRWRKGDGIFSGCAQRKATYADLVTATRPNFDYAQLFWGFAFYNQDNTGMHFPNHRVCCLIKDDHCHQHFTAKDGMECARWV